MCYGEGICNLMSWFRLYVRYTFPNVEINRPFDTGVCLVTECRNCSTGYPRLLSHSPPETPRLRQLGTNIGRPESNNTSHPGPSEYWLLASSPGIYPACSHCSPHFMFQSFRVTFRCSYVLFQSSCHWSLWRNGYVTAAASSRAQFISSQSVLSSSAMGEEIDIFISTTTDFCWDVKWVFCSELQLAAQCQESLSSVDCNADLSPVAVMWGSSVQARPVITVSGSANSPYLKSQYK